MSAAIKLAAAVLILMILYTVLKQDLPVYAPVLALAGAGVLVIIIAANGGVQAIEQLRALRQIAGEEAFLCLFKCAGILLVTDYTKSLCKDAGLSSAGVCMEFGGRCLILLTAWPIFKGVLDSIENLTL